MGRWNRRYLPRRSYNNYDYQDFNPNAIEENSVPSWEIDFCKSMGISWYKVVNMKKYYCCYDNVVTWDDSASRESFRDSKARYWDKINGLPCDNPLPDPSDYIDEVDWDVEIDPELILDLDREFSNPEETNVDNSEDNNCKDPWEGGHGQGSGAPKTVENPWEESAHGQGSGVPKTVENPWEESFPKSEGPFKGTGWKTSGNNGSWNREDSNGWGSSQNGSSWNRDDSNAWGTRQNESSWNRNNANAWGTRQNDSSWNRDSSNARDTKQSEWGSNNRNSSRGRNSWNDRNNRGNHYDRWGNNNNRNFRNSGGHSNQQPRKKEYASYHDSRFYGGVQEAGYSWQKFENSEQYK